MQRQIQNHFKHLRWSILWKWKTLLLFLQNVSLEMFDSVLIRLCHQWLNFNSIFVAQELQQKFNVKTVSNFTVKYLYIKEYTYALYTYPIYLRTHSVSLSIQPEWRKMRTRINPNTDTFYAVTWTWILTSQHLHAQS